MKRNKLLTTGVGFVTLIAGVLGGNMITQMASAADNSTATTKTQTQTAGQRAKDSSFDPTKGGHVGANGKKEELLTGDTAEKVKAAALVAVPEGTIERVETDAEGAAYEAHMTKSDGSRVTVKLDSNFKVTSTESGMK